MTIGSNDIKERIRRLLALAESSNVNEAAQAAAKASDLLHKYNLSIEDIPIEGETLDEYGVLVIDYEGQAMWRRDLLETIARANNATTVYTAGTTKGKVIGREHEQQITVWMYTYLAGQIQRIAKKEYREYKERQTLKMYPDFLNPIVVPRKWYNSFYYGAVTAISARLNDLRRSQMQESSQSTALVLNREALATQARDRLIGRVSAAPSTATRVDQTAFRKGIEAGKNISLNRRVSGTESRQKQLA